MKHFSFITIPYIIVIVRVSWPCIVHRGVWLINYQKLQDFKHYYVLVNRNSLITRIKCSLLICFWCKPTATLFYDIFRACNRTICIQTLYTKITFYLCVNEKKYQKKPSWNKKWMLKSAIYKCLICMYEFFNINSKHKHKNVKTKLHFSLLQIALQQCYGFSCSFVIHFSVNFANFNCVAREWTIQYDYHYQK